MNRKHTFNEQRCRPVLIDTRTKKPLSDDDPMMAAALGVYYSATLEEKQAFHRLCCENSRDQKDIELVHGLSKRMDAAFTALKEAQKS